MDAMTLVDSKVPSRDLLRQLRMGALIGDGGEVMPESVAWQLFLELRRRGEPGANTLFISALRQLHSRRVVNSVELSNDDQLPEEHRMAADPFLADLWKAYKRCIRFNRTGPASQLLRDIEEQINRA